ncbi:hypothetical protein BC832DRAFT_199411 [Gaertneriomyces semiglobifer]|nr:hypothetical protein BC832DRAFT_199411 [Gaertneriomyces semiglobifer]
MPRRITAQIPLPLSFLLLTFVLLIPCIQAVQIPVVQGPPSGTTTTSLQSIHPALPTNIKSPDENDSKTERECPAAVLDDEPIARDPTCPPPDVYLNVPNLSVASIDLQVEDLVAHVALDAEVATLVKITAGVDVRIKGVKLQIQGVQARLLLEARLDNVYRTLARTLDTLDHNPGILTALADSLKSVATSASDVVGSVGGLAGDVVGSVGDTVGNVGQLVKDTTNTVGDVGKIVKDTTGNTGQVVDGLAGPNTGNLRPAIP